MRTVEQLAARKTVDRYNLDQEAADQSELIYEAGIYLAQAKNNTLKAKANWEAVAAEFAHNIKLNPSIFHLGHEKVTDTLAKDLAKREPEVQTAYSAFLIAYRWEMKIDALFKAVMARQSMLRMLNELWQNNYYGDSAGRPGPKNRTGRRELTEQPEQGDDDHGFED